MPQVTANATLLQPPTPILRGTYVHYAHTQLEFPLFLCVDLALCLSSFLNHFSKLLTFYYQCFSHPHLLLFSKTILGENWPLLAVGKSALADIAAGEKAGVSAMHANEDDFQDANGKINRYRKLIVPL